MAASNIKSQFPRTKLPASTKVGKPMNGGVPMKKTDGMSNIINTKSKPGMGPANLGL
jgi:hypothetical protein